MSESIESRLAYEIAERRHGRDVTASDLANRLMPWLAAELRKAKAEVLREAADDLERDNASPNLIELEGRYAGFYSGIRGATSKAIEKLRTRADELEGENE